MVMEMSKTYQYRKVMKPLLERKRRARINKCLDDLKDLMVECLQQEGEHVTRLEKADILELTVEHMRKLKQTGGLLLQPKQNATAHVESFRSGYVHAADQITQVLFQQRQTDKVGDKIMKFLSTRLIELQHQLLRSPSAAAAISPAPVDPLINTNVNLVLQNSISPAISTLAFLNSSVLNAKESSSSSSITCTSIASASKDIDLIDVTTVEQAASDTSSTSCEFVWRPW